MQHARVVEHGFESGRGGHDVSRGIEERVVRGAENFRGAAAENDIFGFHLVFLREHVREQAISCVGVAIGDGAAIGEVRRGLWARGRRDFR